MTALVLLDVTNPDLGSNPSSKNESTPELKPDKLLGHMRTAFDRKHPDPQDHWQINPFKVPNEVAKVLLSERIY